MRNLVPGNEVEVVSDETRSENTYPQVSHHIFHRFTTFNRSLPGDSGSDTCNESDEIELVAKVTSGPQSDLKEGMS